MVPDHLTLGEGGSVSERSGRAHQPEFESCAHAGKGGGTRVRFDQAAGVGKNAILQAALRPGGIGDQRFPAWYSAPDFWSCARIAASRRSRILTI